MCACTVPTILVPVTATTSISLSSIAGALKFCEYTNTTEVQLVMAGQKNEWMDGVDGWMDGWMDAQNTNSCTSLCAPEVGSRHVTIENDHKSLCKTQLSCLEV